jgi:uncharacterized protein YecT (DUF1311 family)
MNHTENRASRGRQGDEKLNEQFNTVLREAADKREERSLVQATGDALAAKRESADLLALARGQAVEPASGATGDGADADPEPEPGV